jgi:hypothetical protein
MKQTVTKSMFTSEFHKMGRGDQFSHEALCGLYDYLEEHFADDELDVIALCCTYAELELEEVLNDYPQLEIDPELERDEAIYNALNEETVIVWNGNGRVLFQQF